MFMNRSVAWLSFLASLASTLAAGSASPTADDVEGYTRFIENIRDFDRYTNADVNDIVFAGLHSDNPRVVELTVAAIHNESRNRDLRRQFGGPHFGKLDRDLIQVPGLRDFLVDYARKGLAEDGWKAAMDDLASRGNAGNFDFYEGYLWRSIFVALLEQFPGDLEVRRLVWESYHDNQGARELNLHESPLLAALNTGLYVDEDAEEVRRSLLWHSDPHTAGLAARGLAISASSRGLAAMKGVLWRRDESLRDIVAAMASYGAPAAEPLATLQGAGGELQPSLRTSRPIVRLTTQVQRLAEVSGGSSWGKSEQLNAASVDAPDERFTANGLPIVDHRSQQAPLDGALLGYDDYPDGGVLDAAFAGLHDGDERATERTILALGTYASAIVERDWPQYSPKGNQQHLAMDTRTRPLDEVPGLRVTLASHARRELAGDGCRRQARRADGLPPWLPSVATLAAYFPANAEVRDLVLEMGRCLREAGADYGVLPLLAAGRFRGEAVDREAMDELRHADPKRAGWGARHLCWTLTDEGLAGLVAALDRRDDALADIVEGVACFGHRAVPHLPALRALPRGRLSEAAFARVESATAKVAKLAALAAASAESNAPG